MTTLKRFKHTTGLPDIIFLCGNYPKLAHLISTNDQKYQSFPPIYGNKMHLNAIFVFFYSIPMVIVDTMDILKVKETHDRAPKHKFFMYKLSKIEYKLTQNWIQMCSNHYQIEQKWKHTT